MEYQNDDIMFD